MNPEPDHSPNSTSPRSGWKDPILALVYARLSLFQHELKLAIGERGRSAVALVAAAFCLLFTWALIMAGGTAAIADVSGWPWHVVALGFAAIHLLAALLLLRLAKAPKSPPFPITRSEFEKDREWIESLKNKPQSKS